MLITRGLGSGFRFGVGVGSSFLYNSPHGTHNSYEFVRTVNKGGQRWTRVDVDLLGVTQKHRDIYLNGKYKRLNSREIGGMQPFEPKHTHPVFKSL